MKKTKKYQKGNHLYIKSGDKKEVHILKGNTEPELEYDANCREVYTDEFRFEIKEEGIKIFFEKKIFGTNGIKPQLTILLPKGTAKRMLKLVENVLK